MTCWSPRAVRGEGLRAYWRAGRVALWLLLGSGSVIAAEHHVTIQDDEFLPHSLTIAPGDTVIWTNIGGDHTVTSDDELFSSTTQGGAAIPFNGTFTHTFNANGRFPYYCQLHGAPGGQGMSAAIRVAPPGENALPATPVNTTPATGAVNQSTSPTLSADAFSDTDEGDVHASSQWILRTVADNAIILDTNEDAEHLTSLPLTGLPGGAEYSWQVRYRDDRGAWSAYSTATTFTTVTAPTASGSGLLASYGSYIPRTGVIKIRATQVDAKVDLDWKLGKPHRLVAPNNFFVRWEGSVVPEFSETYRFRVRADGGVRLWIDGEMVIEDWMAGTFAVYRSGTIDLQAGVPVAIKLEYFDTITTSSISLRWASPSKVLEVVPTARLYPPPATP
jgi:plastocyanin